MTKVKKKPSRLNWRLIRPGVLAETIYSSYILSITHLAALVNRSD